MERPALMIVSDEEHLSPPAGPFDVCSNEAKDVVMPHEDSLVDLCLPEPARLLGSEEHFHCNPLTAPPARKKV